MVTSDRVWGFQNMGIKGKNGYGTTEIGERLWYESVTVVAVTIMIKMTKSHMTME